MKPTVTFKARVLLWTVTVAAVLTISPLPLHAAGKTLDEVSKAIDEGMNYKALSMLSLYTPSREELPRFFYLKGKALIGAKRYTKAIGYLNRAYLTTKDDDMRERALFARGVAYLMGGFHYEAASNFRLFIRRYPKSRLIQRAYLNYAQASLKTGNYVEALAFFRKVSRTPEAVFGRAEVFHRLGLYSAANDLYNAGLLSYKDYIEKHPDVIYYYAENLRVNGKAEQAKSFYYFLMDTYLRERAYLGIGQVEYERKDLESAEMYLKKALESPDRVVRRRALLTLGKTAMEAGHPGRAVEYLRALRMDYPYTPEYEEALLLLARLMREKKEYLQAGKYLREILFGRKPGNEALDELDALVNDSIDNDLEAFRRIWDSSGQWLYDPSREETLFKVAEALRNSGGDFLRVYTYLVDNGSRGAKAKSLSRLAIFFGRLSDVGRVEKLVGNLGKLTPNGDEFLRAKAWLYYLKGRNKAAYSLITRTSHPVSDDIDLLWRVKESAPSVRSFIKTYKAMAKASGVTLRYTDIGGMLAERGFKKSAVKYFDLALKVDPGDTRAMFMLSRITGDIGVMQRLSVKKGLYGSMARVMIKEKEIRRRLLEM
ncbi:MAG TPA: tetratricopeptide repeat protein [Nitrospirae bacterium]|nr:tetratricopeptide repeat protein [Nitrospirota bacterium]